MSKCQTDGFSEADGILGTGQRGRGGETEVQSMGIRAGLAGGGGGWHRTTTQACLCVLSVSHLECPRPTLAVLGSKCPTSDRLSRSAPWLLSWLPLPQATSLCSQRSLVPNWPQRSSSVTAGCLCVGGGWGLSSPSDWGAVI